MGNIFTTGLFRQMLRSATPVALAAMGGLLTEHAGVMNIGMDGMILIGAFVAVAVSVVTGSAALGVLAAILVGVLVGAFFALFVVKFKSDEFIIGTALNIFAGGLTVFLLGALFGVRGTLRTQAGLPTVDLPLIDQIPFLGEVLSGNSLFIYLTVLIVLIMWTLCTGPPGAVGSGPAASIRGPCGPPASVRRGCAGRHPCCAGPSAAWRGRSWPWATCPCSPRA